MTTKYNGLQEVRAKLGDFEARRAGARNNPDLSEAGRRRQLDTINAEAANYRRPAYDSLRLTWYFIRRDYADLDRRTAEAQETAGRRWDYQRLNYEAQAAQVALKNAAGAGLTGDFEAARRVFDTWASSGDSHRARAMLEHGPEILQARFSGSNGLEVHHLAKDAERRLDALMTTPELQALTAEGGELVHRAIEAHEATQRTALFFDPHTGKIFDAGNEFTGLLSGISLTQKFAADSLGIINSLEITGELPPADAEPGETTQARRERLGI